MNEKTKQKLKKFLKSLPIWYIKISWSLAIGLALYYFVMIPILKWDISSVKASEIASLQQINFPNLTLSEKAFYLENYEPLYYELIQGLQSDILPITPQQFGFYELILIIPAFNLLPFVIAFGFDDDEKYKYNQHNK